MDNGLIYLAISGAMFFPGAALLLGGLLVPSRKRIVAALRRLASLVGICLVACSATPLPMWFYAAGAISIVAALVAASRLHEQKPRAAMAARLAMIIPILAAVGVELPRHIMPSVAMPPAGPIVVIGDSLSAGIGGDGVALWPDVLAGRYGREAANLAVPGATVASAMKQAERLPETSRLVLVEIGGNDTLGTTRPAQFEADLDALIRKVRSPGRTVVMFELPLLPFQNAFGRAQRRVADAHDVVLIPKRLLAGVFAVDGATTDGIHLSNVGHARLADAVAGLLDSDRQP